MTAEIRVSADARFTCRSCGRCCQGWAVPVDQQTVDRLRSRSWGGEPFEATSTGEHPYRIRLVNGRCFFLDDTNRCRIQSELSYEAKPDVCRAFPLAVLDVNGTRHARMSYWCPTVADNVGRPLVHQMRWVHETARHADHRTARFMLNGRIEIESRTFDQVHAALHRLLAASEAKIADRIAAAAALVRRMVAAAAAAPDVSAVCRAAIQGGDLDGIARLTKEMRSSGRAASGRRVLALYLLQDASGGRASLLGRFFAVMLFTAGWTRLRSRVVSGRASWRELRAVADANTPSADGLVTRYLVSKLESRRYVAGAATLVEGVNMLCVAYAVAMVLARVRAAASGRACCDEGDIRAGLGAADLLVVEHAARLAGGLHGRLARAALGEADLCGDVLASLDPK